MLIYGTNPVKEAFNANRKIYELFHVKDTHKDIIALANKQNIKTSLLDKQAMNRKFGAMHQNIAANVADYEAISLQTALEKEGKKLFVMLDGVEDPHNLGAVIRNVDAFGASGIILPKNRSASVNPTVVKVSSGAIEYVDIIQVTNLNQAIRTLKQHNVWVVGLDVDTEDSLDDIFVDTDITLVFGNEGKGISRLVKENCDYLVKIPMQGTVNSLNISASAAVALHDIKKRQRG